MSNPISNFVKKLSLFEWTVFFLMVLVGLASRAYLLDYPNFKPIAAFVLFGGFFFRHWLVALVAMLTVMFLSDYRIAVYEGPLMFTVYFSLAIGVVLGVLIRHKWGPELKGWGWVPGFAAASLLMAVTFSLLADGSVWLFTTWYPKTWRGLVDCYIAGLPFLRATLLSNLVFTMATVGVYYVARNLLFGIGSNPGKRVNSRVLPD